ncbi:MAG: phosphate--AMP phosphotransferase [Candidatus Hydrogenedentes bacterium]|nr:phosphate--AMP phosphotransferase [Candidatus Hydrogenedentota bacterium]
MLETIDPDIKLDEDEYRRIHEKLDLRLTVLQQEIRKAGIPVIIIFEGWEASGKGTAIGRLLQPLDPRGYRVQLVKLPSAEERLRPPMRRFWLTLPANGMIHIYDRSWYHQILEDRVEKLVPKKQWQGAYERLQVFERQLADDGAVILKFWLHITKSEQAKRFKALAKDPAFAWKVGKEDKRQHRRYKKYYEAAEDMLTRTSTAHAPWTVAPSHDKHWAQVKIGETVVSALEAALARKPDKLPAPKRVARRASPFDKVDLNQKLARKDYDRLLPELQDDLRRLEHLIYVARIPVMLLYEGWDAAGKGGNIRRLTRQLDPRGYEVVSISAPTGEEKTHHYLWRFWRNVPKAGHITIFDRSWYGRLLVERVEGFATPVEWQRAYQEINEFETELASFGTVIGKFWIHISRAEQLRRFRQREELPYKRWKITEEDWRNRKKWNDYYYAASDMIEKTSTGHAPWTIIEGNDKLHARVKTLKVTIAAIERALRKKNDD